MEIVRYDRSHLAKLTFLSDKMKMYYERLKNHILSFEKIKNNTSWDGERFYYGRTTLIRLQVRGKTINIYFALTPGELDAKYQIVDCSEVKKYQALPSMLKMKGPRSFGYAVELVNLLMEEEELDYVDEYAESYAPILKSRPIETLCEEGLAKPIYGEKAPSKINLYDDEDDEGEEEEEEETPTTTTSTNTLTHTTCEVVGYKKGQVARSLRDIINLDKLDETYSDGEEVTLDSLKDKGLIRNEILYVKVLAKGSLNKKLSIKLNEYSKEVLKKIKLK